MFTSPRSSPLPCHCRGVSRPLLGHGPCATLLAAGPSWGSATSWFWQRSTSGAGRILLELLRLRRGRRVACAGHLHGMGWEAPWCTVAEPLSSPAPTGQGHAWLCPSPRSPSTYSRIRGALCTLWVCTWWSQGVYPAPCVQCPPAALQTAPPLGSALLFLKLLGREREGARSQSWEPFPTSRGC